MYAIVKTGGKQYKVAVGDVVEIEKLDAALGAEVALSAILLVDGAAVTHEADELAKVAVTAEIIAQTKGPKIRIHKYKNKTGYHKRMGHRQKLTQIQVTGIGDEKAKATKAPAAKVAAARTARTAKAPAAKVATADEAMPDTAAAEKATAEKAPAARGTATKVTATKATATKTTATKATPSKATPSKATASKATEAKASATEAPAKATTDDTD